MRRLIPSLLFLLVLLPFATVANAAPIVSFVGANPILTPDFSTTFAPLPSSNSLSSPQSFDGFTFTQGNGQPNDIWTTYNPGGGTGRGWYPNGGDNGYTEITLITGDDFGDVSLFVGSGNGSHAWLAYDLLDDGLSIASGVLSGHQVPFHWLSITGGGFDTIRLRDGRLGTIAVGDNTHNALAFDRVFANEATPVPEPASIAIWSALGVAGFFGARQRRKNAWQ